MAGKIVSSGKANQGKLSNGMNLLQEETKNTGPKGHFFTSVRPPNVKQTTIESLAYIIGAFGFVAALAWNEAIKALLNRLFAADDTIVSLFIYAILVTLIAVIATSRLSKFRERIER